MIVSLNRFHCSCPTGSIIAVQPVPSIALDNKKNYALTDLYHLFDDILQSRYIGSITHKMEKEYRTFRKYDIRPY